MSNVMGCTQPSTRSGTSQYGIEETGPYPPRTFILPLSPREEWLTIRGRSPATRLSPSEAGAGGKKALCLPRYHHRGLQELTQ